MHEGLYDFIAKEVALIVKLDERNLEVVPIDDIRY